MVSELVEFKGRLNLFTHQAQRVSAGREGDVLGKIQVSHQIDKTLEKSKKYRETFIKLII
ncbi:hypothetical protein MTR_3g078480 [Medicago truncatula]|uniref:Uncharacterized protein n=1 Tax=Medicago truncatula TaxID=3880 RepID=A0A072UZ50_MEDTR|nr:hypothetical protein MTR_3g078480 [Medicago truncatula]